MSLSRGTPAQRLATLRPPSIGERPVIRVVFPCGTTRDHQGALWSGVDALRAAGAEVRCEARRSEAEWRGYLAGSDTERADELVRALTEPGVDVVWVGRGGSGAARIVSAVVERLRDAPPRALVGFSDASTLLNLLALELGWATFHGPVVTSLSPTRPVQVDLERVFTCLRGACQSLAFPHGAGDPVTGPLLGGNLTVLCTLAAAGLLHPVPGAIWLLEEVGEAPYAVDRAFWSLRRRGLFDGAAAVWLGDLGTADPLEVEARIAEDAPCRVIGGAPAGHRGRLEVLPIGQTVSIDPRAGTLSTQTPWVALRPNDPVRV